MIFHPLDTAVAPPDRMNNPFDYTPHPLCIAAARKLQERLPGLMANYTEERGKMFGVLVVEHNGRTGYLQAYSGQLGGGYPHTDDFVPPVFDYLQPTGHFRQTEQRISALNRSISLMKHDAAFCRRKAAAGVIEACASRSVEAWHKTMTASKLRRDSMRAMADDAMRLALIRESQYQKAQLRRIRHRWDTVVRAISGRIGRQQGDIDRLVCRRRKMSDDLQQWLFSQFVMYNGRGESRPLSEIFARHDPGRPYLTPPGGAGECCEPKLLQYAYRHGMRPLCMAMFWWGEGSDGEIRHHLQYYPACQSKCRPILTFMLQGIDVEKESASKPQDTIETVYEDKWMAVINKPAGMLSVPGRAGSVSVAELMRRRHPAATGPMMVHRLDMDTSGLMIIALDADVYRQLQRQFADRRIHKTYVARLEEGRPPAADSGEISLPLRPATDDRPRQIVDRQYGKPAHTRYHMNGKDRVTLCPLTGRTHQLRVHCAHPQGLGRPILGDKLYGHGGGRLYLHAASLRFTHPVTGKAMEFMREPDF